MFTHGWHLAIPGGVLAPSRVLDVIQLRLRCPMDCGLAGKRNLPTVNEHRNSLVWLKTNSAIGLIFLNSITLSPCVPRRVSVMRTKRVGLFVRQRVPMRAVSIDDAQIQAGHAPSFGPFSCACKNNETKNYGVNDGLKYPCFRFGKRFFTLFNSCATPMGVPCAATASMAA